LIRFLFGDVRVDIWLDVEDIRLPLDVQNQADQGKKIDALYQFEVLASPRGKLWYLTRRVAEEDSVACLAHETWRKSQRPHKLYLSTLFLANRARVNKDRSSLAYSMTLGVRVPDYEVEQKLWIDKHYEGGYLFRDAVVVEIVPPTTEAGDWHVNYDWQSDKSGEASLPLPAIKLNQGKVELTIDFASDTTPGIRGKVRFVVSKWNA
jgi:hypothetical protein